MVGQALGDALGFVVEGYPPETCRGYVDSAVWPRRLPLTGRGRGEYPVGQYTDDTQLARELALSLVDRGGFDPQDYAARISALGTRDRIVGIGLATRSAVRRLLGGISWDAAGAPAGEAGNGTAMRAAPVGLLLCHDHAAMISVAHQQGWITHHDPRCSAGSVAIAGATALAVTGEATDASALCARLAEWTEPFDSELARALLELPGWVGRAPEDALAEISRVGVPPQATSTTGPESRRSLPRASCGASTRSCDRHTTTGRRSARRSRWEAMSTRQRR